MIQAAEDGEVLATGAHAIHRDRETSFIDCLGAPALSLKRGDHYE